MFDLPMTVYLHLNDGNILRTTIVNTIEDKHGIPIVLIDLNRIMYNWKHIVFVEPSKFGKGTVNDTNNDQR